VQAYSYQKHPSMLIDHFNNTIDTWIDALDQYSLNDLQYNPDRENWALGQVYLHLINETQFYITQIESCLKHNDNENEKMKDTGVTMFTNNSFPDEKIKGDPESMAKVHRSFSKSALETGMKKIKTDMNELWTEINNHETRGKSMHPGLGYFNAIEWFQFAEMHLRHHLRQKRRIEEALYF
jgi:DinB superfamily